MQRRSFGSRPIGLSLAAILLVSCAKDDQVASTADSANEPAASEIVVTGSIAMRSKAERDLYAPPPPPPAPPAMAMAPMYDQKMVAPPYHDQGRDKFTSVA